jgi:hypothetical protein
MLSKISASGIGELLTGGKTAESYLLKKAMECLGIESELSTKAMEHGIINQYEAFELIVSHMDNAKWHDEFTAIDEYCGASADCIGDEMVYDIKCPFFVDTYLEQAAKLPKKYYYQSQMQMIAEGKEFGSIVLYLTSSEIDMYGNKIEFPYPLEDRFFIHTFPQDEEAIDRILTTAKKGHGTMIEWAAILKDAPIKDKDEFFYEQIKGHAVYRKLKTAGSIENAIKKAVRVGNEYYYLIK